MENELSALTKMWISFFAIGLMVISAVIVSFARIKTRGWIKAVLMIVAVILLMFGLLYAFVAVF